MIEISKKTKTYKYKELMVEKGVREPCPFPDCREEDVNAFHYGFDPIDDEGNFVPGHRRAKQRINDINDPRNCAYCGLSMYKTEAGARKKWKELLQRHRDLLKYTHLLIGELKKELGVMSAEAGEHFTFFEYEGVELREHFKVYDTL